MVYIDTDISNFDLDAALGEISAQRRSQALRFSHEQGRRQCVAAYMLLKRALRSEFGITDNIEFGYEDGGKPFIRGHADIHFNLSHCRSAVACAVGRSPVGVDIESIRPFKEALARYVLSPDEYQFVASSPRPDVEFTKLWTKKESVLKLTGRGLRADLKSLLPVGGIEHIVFCIGQLPGASQTPMVFDESQFACNAEHHVPSIAATPHIICTVCRHAR